MEEMQKENEKKRGRTFKQLEKEKSLRDLNDFAKKVTESYALSIPEYSLKNLAADNNLTLKGARDLMDYAIVTAQVSREIATKVFEKTIRNQQRKVKNAGGSSIQHHKRLIRLRDKYLADNCARVKIMEVAKEIATSNKSISSITRKHNLESEGVTKWLLERAIAENIATDKETEAIIARSLKVNNTESAKMYFQELRKRRKESKKENS